MKSTRTFTAISHLLLIVLIGIALFQVVLLYILAGKSPGEIATAPFAPSLPIHWENFTQAWNLGIRDYLKNSIFLSTTIVVGDVFFSVLAAYVFARYTFPGKTLLFGMVMALMMVPGILTLVPRYLLIRDLKLLNTMWAVILPSILGSNSFQIIVMRTFFQSLPEELFEAARIDGAGHIPLLFRISLPLSIPIISSMAILRFNGAWNDLIWPLLVLNRDELRPISVGLVMLSSGNGAPDIGVQMAGSVIASLPMIVIFLIGMRSFIDGLSAGAIKL